MLHQHKGKVLYQVVKINLLEGAEVVQQMQYKIREHDLCPELKG